MKRILVLASACAVFAGPALAQSSSGTTPSPAAESVSSSAAPSTDDFVKKAAISDMFEIRSSELALKKKAKGDSAFAKKMIHDHSETTAQLKKLVGSGKVKAKLPAALDGEHQQMLDQLSKESGADFTKDYDQMQLNGHKEAVAMFASYAKNGDNPALKRWAAKTLPHLQEHLMLAEKLS